VTGTAVSVAQRSGSIFVCGFIRRLGNDAQIRPRCLPATRILFPGFVVGKATADDDVVAGFPVRWCRD
jgi:hypothetical protein